MSPQFGSLGQVVLAYRRPIATVLLAVTAFMALAASRVRLSTRFVDLFPRNHRNTTLNEQFERYGSPETVFIVLEVRHGDIFNFKTLNKIQDLQYAADALPYANHYEVYSLASYRTNYVYAVPGGVNYRCYMYPYAPRTQAGIDALRENVYAHKNELRNLISSDFKRAVISVSFNQSGSGQDYAEVFREIQAIVKKYQDSDHTIYVAGEPVVRGYGYYYFPAILSLFLASIAIMVLALYVSLGNFTSWWVPIITGASSAIWGLGFVGLNGYDFDPLMLVVPLILTARDMSHGVQWQRRYYYLLDQLQDQTEACRATTDYMFPAGFLAILADVSGIVFISFSGITVLDHIARAGTVWLLASLLMVFIFQPILMSYLPVSRRTRPRWPALSGRLAAVRDLGQRLGRFGVEPGPGRGALLIAATAFLIWGIASGFRAQVGYRHPGTPLYRPGAKVNRDIRAIVRDFPVDEGWIVIEMRRMSRTENPLSYDELRLENELRAYLLQSPAVRDVVTFADDAIGPFMRVIHDGHPKFLGFPKDLRTAAAAIMFFVFNQPPGTVEKFLLGNSTVIRVLLKDHTAETLTEVQRRIGEFARQHQHDPLLPHTAILYFGGIAGLYAAADDVLLRLDLTNVTFVLAAIFILCAISFRSLVAGVLFVSVCILANLGAFIYLHLRQIGLTIDTVPVISLGIGLGVDYGIYTVARIRDEVRGGMPLGEAVVLARIDTGGTVLMVLAIMVGALIPWAFSPALFHTNMSLMLAMLMALNAIGGVLVLPSFIAWSKSDFICRHAPLPSAIPQQAPLRST